MNNLKAFRENQGLTQTRMAEKLSIDDSHYQAIESGRIRLNSGHIHKYISAFPNIDLNTLFGISSVEKTIYHPDDKNISKLCAPLQDLINNHYDPHTSIIVSMDRVEITNSTYVLKTKNSPVD